MSLNFRGTQPPCRFEVYLPRLLARRIGRRMISRVGNTPSDVSNTSQTSASKYHSITSDSVVTIIITHSHQDCHPPCFTGTSVFWPLCPASIVTLAGTIGVPFWGDRLYKCSAVAEMGDRLANRHGPKIEELCSCFGGGAGSPCNTLWPGPRPTFVPSAILIHPAVWPQQTWAENWGRLCHLCGWSWVRIKHSVARAEPYHHTKWHLGPSSRLATIDNGRKFGGSAPF